MQKFWVIYHKKTKQNKYFFFKLQWDLGKLTHDYIIVQTIHVQIFKEENCFRVFLFPITSLSCSSQPTHLPSDHSCLTAEMTSGPQGFLSTCHRDKTVTGIIKLSEVQAVDENI